MTRIREEEEVFCHQIVVKLRDTFVPSNKALAHWLLNDEWVITFVRGRRDRDSPRILIENAEIVMYCVL